MCIGVNYGFFFERMLFIYGDILEGMVEFVLEFIKICEFLDYYNLVIFLKVLWVLVMLVVYWLMVKWMDELGMFYFLYLGVIEVGDGEYGWIKFIAGIVIFLVEGIGDIICVFLIEVFEKEILVCYSIF